MSLGSPCLHCMQAHGRQQGQRSSQRSQVHALLCCPQDSPTPFMVIILVACLFLLSTASAQSSCPAVTCYNPKTKVRWGPC